MKGFFINLKRFDIPKRYGGICLIEDPKKWVEGIIEKTINLGLGRLENVNLVYLLPEGLVLPAVQKLAEFSLERTKRIDIGIQGVFREDTVSGGNFGAFSTNVPAAAAKNFGCIWAMNGHSEERKDKTAILASFEPAIESDQALMKKASDNINVLINLENKAALKRGMNVLYCVGETAEEKGKGSIEDQKKKTKNVLKDQIEIGLEGVRELLYGNNKIVIGYEPRWAIGPGKVPPDGEYIGFVSAYIKDCARELLDLDIEVVYGGGLKKENAAMIAGIRTINGGLVALTKFEKDFNFEPEGLKAIIEIYGCM